MARAPSPIAECRGILYALLTVACGCALTVGELALYPLVKLLDPTLFSYHRATMFLSRCIIALFGVRPVVRGREHLVCDRGAIIVANHQSDLDSNLISCATFDINFKCVYKRELWLFPGIGSAMFMAGYIVVNRGNRASAAAMMEACRGYLSRGVWVLFFPEGTRKHDGSTGNMGEFKAGAFKLALETGAPLQPMTVSGSRHLMSAFGTVPALHYSEPGSPIVTIHAAILPRRGDTVESLSARVRAVIGSQLRPCDDLEDTRKTPASAPLAATAAAVVSSMSAEAAPLAKAE